MGKPLKGFTEKCSNSALITKPIKDNNRNNTEPEYKIRTVPDRVLNMI
jgi:hypothetical protein